MLLKSYSRKEMREIMNDSFQNKLAIKFIHKYLYECTKRNNKLMQQTKELGNVKNKIATSQKNQIIIIR